MRGAMIKILLLILNAAKLGPLVAEAKKVCGTKDD